MRWFILVVFTIAFAGQSGAQEGAINRDSSRGFAGRSTG